MSGIPERWLARLDQEAQQRRQQGRSRFIQSALGVDFASNDYLGLRRDPRLAEASARAAREWGSGSGGARLLRGTSPLHDQLERELALWKGQASALLFNTGYQANASLIPALAGPGDAVFSDALNHASLIEGCRLAKARGAHVGVYAHNDSEDLRRQLSAWASSAPQGALALVVSDGIFSMDGDAADLRGLSEVCECFGALLMVDEAHASGLLGPNGAGLAAHQGVRVPLVMGTLGKALGAFGAFVACAEALRDHLLNTARGFIFSTALPPTVVGAALEGLRLAQTEPWRAARALALAARIRLALGLPPQPSAIVPIHVGEDAAAVSRAEGLQALGLDVRAVRPPTVPEGTARLRITTGAHLTDAEVEALIHALVAHP